MKYILFCFLLLSGESILAQNVGINTDGSAPLMHLHLKTQASSSSDGLLIENPNTGDGDAVVTFRNNGGADEWTLGFDDSDADKFMINNGNGLDATPDLTIQSNGNVGVNTNTPDVLFDVESAGQQEPMGRFYSTNDDVSLKLQSGYSSGSTHGEAYIEFQNTHSGANGWQFGLNDGSSLTYRYGSLGTIGTGTNFVNGETLIEIESGGDMGIGKSPDYKLDVDGFTSSGMITMGMDCSYEGDLGSPEHNDYGCFMCAVNPTNGNLFCTSTRNDQEEVGDIASNTPTGGVWTNWTNFGFPGPAGTYIQEIEVHVAATDLRDSGSFNCNAENDWAASIAIRLSNGDIYFRMTSVVDVCVENIGGSTVQWSSWLNFGQP